jgi:hypothetical protein
MVPMSLAFEQTTDGGWGGLGRCGEDGRGATVLLRSAHSWRRGRLCRWRYAGLSWPSARPRHMSHAPMLVSAADPTCATASACTRACACGFSTNITGAACVDAGPCHCAAPRRLAVVTSRGQGPAPSAPAPATAAATAAATATAAARQAAGTRDSAGPGGAEKDQDGCGPGGDSVAD